MPDVEDDYEEGWGICRALFSLFSFITMRVEQNYLLFFVYFRFLIFEKNKIIY